MVEVIKKRKFLPLVFLSIIVIGLFLPLKPVWGSIWIELPVRIAAAIFQSFAYIFVALSAALLGFAELLLRFILSGNFINIPYTTENPFVEHGWTFVRDFVNMFFIIILVIIGLATALRLSEYQWQKTLPRLILIILLINFTPIILGLIIDASNIVMNFFISGIEVRGDGVFVPRMQQYHASIQRTVKDIDFSDPATFFGVIIQPTAYIIFNIIAAVIYLLFAFLFIFRYIALWTLVILSPLAFFCYILPATKQIFSMWWKQFIQWCLIGVIAAFFIYLGDYLLYLIMTGEASIKESDIEGLGLINNIIPYYVVIAFLVIGFFASLSFAPMGTNAVFSSFQKGAKNVKGWATKKTRRGVEKRLKLPERAGRLGRRAAGKPIFGLAAEPLLSYSKRRKGEEKKELEGIPFIAQAKMTRKRGQTVKDKHREIIQGMSPRDFAKNARADDLNTETFLAMSTQQTKTLNDRGSIGQKKAIQRTLKENSGDILKEYKKLKSEGKDEERKKLRDNLKYIRHNYTI